MYDLISNLKIPPDIIQSYYLFHRYRTALIVNTPKLFPTRRTRHERTSFRRRSGDRHFAFQINSDNLSLIQSAKNLRIIIIAYANSDCLCHQHVILLHPDKFLTLLNVSGIIIHLKAQCLHQLRFRDKTQRLIGYQQNIFLLHRENSHVRGQSGLQLQIMIISRYHHLISHHRR